MSNPFLLDTGPLVALLERNDYYHDWAKQKLVDFPLPFLSCEGVISEACFLSRKTKDGPLKVMEMIRRQSIILPFNAQSEILILEALMGKYSNVPMSFADACLVRMAELYPRSTVITSDKDFFIYRKHGNQRIPLLMPED